MLYVTTGWTENRALPQDLNSIAGKILRLTPDGTVPADNPFDGSPIWSFGHRNPQGLAWDGDRLLLSGLRAEGILRITPDGAVSPAYDVNERTRDIVVTDQGIYAITTARSPRRDGPSQDRLVLIPGGGS